MLSLHASYVGRKVRSYAEKFHVDIWFLETLLAYLYKENCRDPEDSGVHVCTVSLKLAVLSGGGG